MKESLGAGELPLFAVIIVYSHAIRGGASFGGATVPLLAPILSLKILAPMASFVGNVSALFILRHDWRDVVWCDLLRVLPWVAIGVAASLYFFKGLDAAMLTRALRAFVIAHGAWSLWTALGRPRREFALQPGSLLPRWAP